ncbi:hypothetical protein [Nocardiopsis sp. NRRL B-16309]|uniref:hypothetical protein n=1 Tax=Nocardiopsis sp. NRRL B-16309 TaxID=1519494 RepID=UPI000A4FDBA2|nr:hypothetical protein [Nocardiopsis sp. NRRL B-16309]
MSAPNHPTTAEIRRVLDAPRGSRFSHTPSPAQTREQRLLGQMAGNPRVAHRQAHGVLPAWMEVAERRRIDRDRARGTSQHQEIPRVPRPRPVPDDGPPPPKPERPPLPRRPRPRPHRHRKPRCRIGRRLAAYAVAAVAGALAHHLATTLL